MSAELTGLLRGAWRKKISLPAYGPHAALTTYSSVQARAEKNRNCTAAPVSIIHNYLLFRKRQLHSHSLSITLLTLSEQLPCLLHALSHRHMERASTLTALTADAVRSVCLQIAVVGPHRRRHLLLHGCKIVQLIHHGDIDLFRAGRTVTAVGTLPCGKGMFRRSRQHAGVILFLLRRPLIGCGGI